MPERHAEGKQNQPSQSVKDTRRVIGEGGAFFVLGFVGFLVSFWWTGKVKAIVGIATLYGGGVLGYGLYKLAFGDRWPKLVPVVVVLSSLAGLFFTLLMVFLILGEALM